eukprot:8255357-Pyramimonas_sp.AAC.1
MELEALGLRCGCVLRNGAAVESATIRQRDSVLEAVEHCFPRRQHGSPGGAPIRNLLKQPVNRNVRCALNCHLGQHLCSDPSQDASATMSRDFVYSA